MVVPEHTLVVPCGANGRSMVISSLFWIIIMCSVLCQFFLGSVHDMSCVHYLREYNIDIFIYFYALTVQ